MAQFAIKRVYDPPEKTDGIRVLVDRIWPRGLSKDAAKVDLWMKDVAPSTALRKWFNHEPEKWATFQQKYRAELHALGAKLNELKTRAQTEHVTLLYGAKDTEHNQAVVLQEVLSGRKSRSAAR